MKRKAIDVLDKLLPDLTPIQNTGRIGNIIAVRKQAKSEAQKALYEDLGAIVGEDESLNIISGKTGRVMYIMGQNELKAEIRTKLREYFELEAK